MASLLAFFLLLGTLHGTRGQYDNYDDYNYEDLHEDFVPVEYVDEYEEEAVDDEEPRPIDSSGEEGGSPPSAGPQNQRFTPMCNNENCWIRVDWEPPSRETWMSCILGYRVGFRKHGEDWHWINDEGTHIDVRSNELFFFEEADGTNHSLTISNLDFETNYEVIVEVFSPYGRTTQEDWHDVATPPGSRIKVVMYSNLNPTEPCLDAFVPEPDKFVESSENSLSLHLEGWQDTNCPTVYFMVEQRWSLICSSNKNACFICKKGNEGTRSGAR